MGITWPVGTVTPKWTNHLVQKGLFLTQLPLESFRAREGLEVVLTSLEFVCQCGQPHSPRASEKLICTFSYRSSRESLILSQLPLHSQIIDPDSASNHCPSWRLCCISEFIPTPGLEYIYFIYNTIVKAFL